MEKTTRRRVLEIVISVLAAIGIWLYVDTTTDIDSSLTVRNIPVEFIGENTTLADKGLMLLSGYDTTVDLVLVGSRNVLYKLDTDKLRVVANTAAINNVGTQTLSYTTEYPDNIPRNSISVKDASVYSVTVTVGELYKKEVPVYCTINGEAASGYFTDTPSLDVSNLTLYAQREDLLNVSYARVGVNVNNANTTIIETVEYELYDYNDVPVENDSIRCSTKHIQVTLPIRTTKTVPLAVELRGAPGSAADTVAYTVEPGYVTIIGEGNTLKNIGSIVLGTIYVEDLAPYQTFSYEITPPVGTYLADDAGRAATVRVTVEGADEAELIVDDITCINVAEGLKAVAQDELSVTVWGLEEEVEEITAMDVQVSADMKDITEPGTYTVPATITITYYEDIAVKGTYQIAVTVTARGGTGDTATASDSNA